MMLATEMTFVLALSVFLYGVQAITDQGLMRKSEIPDSGNSWLSLPDGSQFQPASEEDDPEVAAAVQEARARFLRRSYSDEFIDSSETYYDDYAQAWRLLGFYIDCNAQGADDGRRHLEEDEENNNDGDESCVRMILWAAYVDLDYKGGGIGEYKFWDRSKKRWNRQACKKSSGNRCVKMDCHLKGTRFKLLGIFKHPDLGDWMAQLAKHSGSCKWDENEYASLQNDLGYWPEACTATNSRDDNGNRLYYHTRPEKNGRLSIGLYTDEDCVEDYNGKITAEEALYKMYGGGDGDGDGDGDDEDEEGDGDNDGGGSVLSLAQSSDKWNDALDDFRVCQPCVAYDLDSDGSYGGGDDGEDADYGAFACVDQAGGVNVNQCYKFSSQTEMYSASFQDVALASEQGTISGVRIMGKSYGYQTSRRNRRWGTFFLLLSMLVLALGIFMFWKARQRAQGSSLAAPLVRKNGVAA